MILDLLLGLPVMLLGLLLQMVLLLAAMRYYRRQYRQVESPSFLAGLAVLGGVMMLLLGNLGQIGLWALLFVYLDEFTDFPTAFYHSAVNFATLGYGDIVMSARHRLLGPLESLNGILMIGISSSVLMTTFQDAIRKTVAARRKSSNRIS